MKRQHWLLGILLTPLIAIAITGNANATTVTKPPPSEYCNVYNVAGTPAGPGNSYSALNVSFMVHCDGITPHYANAIELNINGVWYFFQVVNGGTGLLPTSFTYTFTADGTAHYQAQTDGNDVTYMQATTTQANWNFIFGYTELGTTYYASTAFLPSSTSSSWWPDNNVVVQNTSFGPFGGPSLGCQFSTATGDLTKPTSDGTSFYPYTIDFTGSADAIVLVDDASTDATTTTLYGKSFTSDSAFDLGNGAGTVSSPDTFQFTPQSGDVVNPHMWCHTGGSGTTGTWVDWGLLSSFEATQGYTPPANGPAGIGACLDATGFSWDHPSTWVIGGLKDAACVAKWAFEPTMCNDAITASCVNYTSTLSDLNTRIPTAYISQTVSAMTTMYTGVNAAMSDGACAAPNIDPWHSVTGPLASLSNFHFQLPAPADLGCTGPNDATVGELFGYRTFLLDLFTFGIWMSTAAILWRMTPWHRAGDGIEIVEQFGGLSDHFMENGVEVRQTNEGSD